MGYFHIKDFTGNYRIVCWLYLPSLHPDTREVQEAQISFEEGRFTGSDRQGRIWSGHLNLADNHAERRSQARFFVDRWPYEMLQTGSRLGGRSWAIPNQFDADIRIEQLINRPMARTAFQCGKLNLQMIIYPIG